MRIFVCIFYCSARDCVIAEPKRATSTTMTPVPDSMELIESCDSGSTTPTKDNHDKERDDSDGEYESSENFDELMTDIDWVQCAGFMGSLISQMTDLKQNIETCIVLNHKSFLIEAKEAAIACKKMAIRLENSVDLALEKYKEEVPVTECDLPDPVSKDPGLRPPITTERQRLYLAQIGPQQPKLFNYPPNEDITSSSKQNRFTAVWFSPYLFLEYSIEKHAAFCYVCQVFPTGIDLERSTQNWSSTGVRKWDKMKSRGSANPGKLSEHFSSKAHNAAFQDYVNFMSNNSHVDSLLDTQVRGKAVQLQEDKENNRAITTERIRQQEHRSLFNRTILRTVCRGNIMVHKQLSLGYLAEKYHTYHAKGIIQAAATGLLAKVLRVDFVVSLMFMRIILWKTKILTESLQKENLNIVDALEAVNGTVKSLEDIRNDDEEILNQIQASTDVLSRNDGDVPAKFAKLHRPRSRPRHLDDNPESPAKTPMMNFYDREFEEVLDILIAQHKDNINASLEKVKALSIILQPTMIFQHEESDVKDLLNLFPHQAPDQAAFTAEFRTVQGQYICKFGEGESIFDYLPTTTEFPT